MHRAGHVAALPLPLDRRHALHGLNDLNRRIHNRFSVAEGENVQDQTFLVSPHDALAESVRVRTVKPFLSHLGVKDEEYATQGVSCSAACS